MQVSSILGVCAVVCVCVTAGVSKEGLCYEREVLDTAIVGYWVTEKKNKRLHY